MIDDAPPLLGVRGKAEVLAPPMIAMVGSRNASAAGVKFAERIARDLGDGGLHRRVGPGARHRRRARIARASPAARSRCWPAAMTTSIRPSTCRCCESILPTGAAVTEMPLGWQPRGRDFPRRNRLISGLSLGVVVVEAARRSGSLITARMALEQGREVFAVPGSPLDPRAEGTNGLLKQGATLVTEAADVLAVLRPILGQPIDLPLEEPDAGPPGAAEPAGRSSATHRRACSARRPSRIDDLVRLSQSSPAVVRTVLLELEIAGRLERHGGGLVSLV